MRWFTPLIYLWTFPTTAIGLLFLPPTLLSGGRARWVAGVLELHGGFTAFSLRRGAGLFLPGGAAAMTLGHVVLGQDAEALDRTRAHERVHVRQCQRWGIFFIPAYLLASLVLWVRRADAYRDNPFEREAYGKIPSGTPTLRAAAK
jgi:hypothetical protein